MDDATVIALATRRNSLLAEFWGVARERLAHHAPGRHWLVTGTRGAGKSYFLRLAQARVGQALPPGQARLLLLPQELQNVHAPHEFLDEVRRMLRVGQGDTGHIAQWRVQDPDQAWATSLQALLAAFDEPLLIVGVENFQKLLPTVFKDDVSASWLRQLLAHEPRIMLLATAVDGSHDQDYQQRLFRQFEHHPLPPWHEAAHRKYLTARARLLGQEPTPMQLARIDAYSRYTGGNARIAAVLAGALLDAGDVLDASNSFNTTLDKLSDYYLEQMDRIPPQTRKLFDALVRGGEPCSQTELAGRVGARQSDISRAFLWLMDAGYLVAERAKGQKDTRYRVADRLFVQWYRMRNLAPGQRGRLAVMAELLADTVAFGDKWRHAQTYLDRGDAVDAQLLADLGLQERGIQLAALQSSGLSLPDILGLGQRMVRNDALPLGQPGISELEQYLACLEAYPSDAALRAEIADATRTAQACQRFEGSAPGAVLVDLLIHSLALETPRWTQVLNAMTHAEFTRFQWDEMVNTFRDEVKQFAQLEPVGAAEIAQLRQWNTRQHAHPWACAWSDLATSTGRGTWMFDRAKLPRLEREAIQACAALAAFSAWRTNADPGQAKRELQWALRCMHTLMNLGATALAEPLLMCMQHAILKSPNPALHDELAMAQVQRGQCLNHAGQHGQAATEWRQALLHWQQTDNIPAHAYVLGRLGWHLGHAGEWAEAEAQHALATALLADAPKPGEAAWHVGQSARYRIAMHGVDSAMHWLQQQAATRPATIQLVCLQQLGDAVWDAQQGHGQAAGYALARVLAGHVARFGGPTPDAALRALFIDMLDVGVALDTLSDLATDLPALVNAAAPPLTIQPLADTLLAWIADLRLDDAGRARIRPSQDPDLSTTLDALNQQLGAKSRIRLGLMTAPVLPARTRALVDRILRFVG